MYQQMGVAQEEAARALEQVVGCGPASLCHTNEKTPRLVTGSTPDLATRSRTPGMARAIG